MVGSKDEMLSARCLVLHFLESDIIGRCRRSWLSPYRAAPLPEVPYETRAGYDRGSTEIICESLLTF